MVQVLQDMVKIPHQKRLFFGDLTLMFKNSWKELSYNNLLDVDAAVNLIAEFKMMAQHCHFKTQQRLRVWLPELQLAK
jgi:AICAR transformylase/IMP cyclohydrolase PurH